MKFGSSTTSQELVIQKNKDFVDLASGYPRFGNDKLSCISARKRMHQIGSKSYLEAMNLAKAKTKIAQSLFKLSGGSGEFPGRALLAPTASLALQRVLSAIADSGKPFLICSPTLDVLFFLARETTRVAPLVATCFKDAHKLVEMSENQPLSGLIFAFPGNPFSGSWRREELVKLAEICASKDIPVIHDGCFGPLATTPADFRPLDHLERAKLKWVEVFDTGKTFDFDHDKISLILADDWSYRRIKVALELVLFSLPLRSLYFWKNFLPSEEAKEYARRSGILLRDNQQRLVNGLNDKGFESFASDTPSFVVAQDGNTKTSTPKIKDFLTSVEIGFVELQNFWQSGQMGGVRLSVARDSECIQEALKRIQLGKGLA